MNGLTLFLIATSACGFALGWSAMKAYEQLEEQEQLRQREAEATYQMLVRASGLLLDYDRALVLEEKSEREQLVTRMRVINRYIAASVGPQGGQS